MSLKLLSTSLDRQSSESTLPKEPSRPPALSEETSGMSASDSTSPFTEKSEDRSHKGTPRPMLHGKHRMSFRAYNLGQKGHDKVHEVGHKMHEKHHDSDGSHHGIRGITVFGQALAHMQGQALAHMQTSNGRGSKHVDFDVRRS